jgi:hypothetical protein
LSPFFSFFPSLHDASVGVLLVRTALVTGVAVGLTFPQPGQLMQQWGVSKWTTSAIFVISGELHNCEYFFCTPGFVTIVWYFFCIPGFVTIVGYIFLHFWVCNNCVILFCSFWFFLWTGSRRILKHPHMTLLLALQGWRLVQEMLQRLPRLGLLSSSVWWFFYWHHFTPQFIFVESDLFCQFFAMQDNRRKPILFEAKLCIFTFFVSIMQVKNRGKPRLLKQNNVCIAVRLPAVACAAMTDPFLFSNSYGCEQRQLCLPSHGKENHCVLVQRSNTLLWLSVVPLQVSILFITPLMAVPVLRLNLVPRELVTGSA